MCHCVFYVVHLSQIPDVTLCHMILHLLDIQLNQNIDFPKIRGTIIHIYIQFVLSRWYYAQKGNNNSKEWTDTVLQTYIHTCIVTWYLNTQMHLPGTLGRLHPASCIIITLDMMSMVPQYTGVSRNFISTAVQHLIQIHKFCTINNHFFAVYTTMFREKTIRFK